MTQIRAWGRQLRVAVVASVLTLGLVASADAAPLLIGSFSWVADPFSEEPTQTLEVSAVGFDPWPVDLTLSDVFVNFTVSGGGTGLAFFDGDVDCNGLSISITAGDTRQSPGDYVGDCSLFGVLPQDIVTASLSFTYDTQLGVVTIGEFSSILGPAFYDDGSPSVESLGIYFEPAEFTAVPEPATLALLGSGLAGMMLRRRRAKRELTRLD